MAPTNNGGGAATAATAARAIEAQEMGQPTAPAVRYSPGQRTLQQIECDLSRVLPARLVGEKPKGGRRIKFLTWKTVQQLLDLYAPGWQNFNTAVVSNERIVVDCRLCVPTSDQGLVCRSSTGDDSEDEDEMPEFANDKERRDWEAEQGQRQYGSPTTRAEGQAFKRAARRFGLGLYLVPK